MPPLYTIITDQDKSEFIRRVNRRSANGWKPVGGPFTTTLCPGFGNVHAFAPTTLASNSDLTIYIEYNQAMMIDDISTEITTTEETNLNG